VLHSLKSYQLELVNGLADVISEEVMPMLRPVSACWQPTDFLPENNSYAFLEQVSNPKFSDKLLHEWNAEWSVAVVGDAPLPICFHHRFKSFASAPTTSRMHSLLRSLVT
jgi:Fatty acid desaturase